MLLLIDYFLVAEGGLGFRIPVHHSCSAVDKSLVVKVAENFDNAFRTLVVHCESRAVPVAACSEFSELFEYYSAVLVGPIPRMFQEFVARKVGLLNALLCKFVYNLCLCGYRRMVRTGHPAGIFALHAGASYENILNSVIQHVSHVQNAGYVWRRDYHRIGFASVGFAAEKLIVKPILIPFRLHLSGVILAC